MAPMFCCDVKFARWLAVLAFLTFCETKGRPSFGNDQLGLAGLRDTQTLQLKNWVHNMKKLKVGPRCTEPRKRKSEKSWKRCLLRIVKQDSGLPVKSKDVKIFDIRKKTGIYIFKTFIRNARMCLNVKNFDVGRGV
jgi:hypothetical protein